jgi:transposase
MHNQLFEAALGIARPWSVKAVDFDAGRKLLTIKVDFAAGTRFPAPGVEGIHPVHDTQIKRLRHLDFFQHECFLEVRTPRVKLPDGRVVLVQPDWVGKLAGFTLLFEALILAMAQQMTFAAVAELTGLSWHRVHAICSRYVDMALDQADLSTATAVAIDETSCRRGHEYITLAADMKDRKVVFVTEGKDAKTIADFADYLTAHNGAPEQVTSVSIDMSPAFIKGAGEHLPNARITFDKFHVVAHASAAIDETRRLEQRNGADPEIRRRDVCVPTLDVPVSRRLQSTQDVFVEQVQRHGIVCGSTIFSDSTSHAPAFAISTRACLKLRAGEGRPVLG